MKNFEDILIESFCNVDDFNKVFINELKNISFQMGAKKGLNREI